MTVGGFEITDLTADEVGEAAALWEQAGLTRPWNDPIADAGLALASETSTILACRLEGRLAATAMVGFDGHRGWVYYLAVAQAHRGRGLGEALMRAAEAWVGRLGAPKIQLMVRRDNASAHGFYEAIGYARESVTVFARRFGGRGDGVQELPTSSAASG